MQCYINPTLYISINVQTFYASSQGYERTGELGLGGGGGEVGLGGEGEYGGLCLRCPHCGLDQAAAPVLYYKPSQYHLQLARLILTLSNYSYLTQN